MTDEELMWSEKSREQILHTPIFDVEKRREESATGISGDYMVINATEWVTIIPVYQGNFVLVRQYRHGLGAITAEFPGGMCDEGEDPVKSAYRELEEETGYVSVDNEKIEAMTECIRGYLEAVSEHDHIRITELTEESFLYKETLI